MAKEKLTQKKRERLERNERIKQLYKAEMKKGGMSSAVINHLAESFNITIPTIYSIIKS